MAVSKNFVHVTKYLLEQGADPNMYQSLSGNALHIAAEKGNLEMIQLLLKHYANTEARNLHGKKPSQIAKDRKIQSLIDGANKEGMSGIVWEYGSQQETLLEGATWYDECLKWEALSTGDSDALSTALANHTGQQLAINTGERLDLSRWLYDHKFPLRARTFPTAWRGHQAEWQFLKDHDHPTTGWQPFHDEVQKQFATYAFKGKTPEHITMSVGELSTGDEWQFHTVGPGMLRCSRWSEAAIEAGKMGKMAEPEYAATVRWKAKEGEKGPHDSVVDEEEDKDDEECKDLQWGNVTAVDEAAEVVTDLPTVPGIKKYWANERNPLEGIKAKLVTSAKAVDEGQETLNALLMERKKHKKTMAHTLSRTQGLKAKGTMSKEEEATAKAEAEDQAVLEAEIIALTEALEAQEAKQKEKEEEKMTLEQKLEEMEKELAAKEVEAQAQLLRVQQEMEQKMADTHAVAKAEADRQKQEMDKQNRALQASIATNTQHRQLLQQMLEKQVKEEAEAQAELQRVQQEMEQKMADKQTAAKAEADRKKQEMHEENEALQASMASMDAQHQQLLQQILEKQVKKEAQGQAELQRVQQEMEQQMAEKHAAAKEEADRQKQEMDEQTKALQASIAAMDAENQQLLQQILDKNAEAEAMQAEEARKAAAVKLRTYTPLPDLEGLKDLLLRKTLREALDNAESGYEKYLEIRVEKPFSLVLVGTDWQHEVTASIVRRWTRLFNASRNHLSHLATTLQALVTNAYQQAQRSIFPNQKQVVWLYHCLRLTGVMQMQAANGALEKCTQKARPLAAAVLKQYKDLLVKESEDIIEMITEQVQQRAVQLAEDVVTGDPKRFTKEFCSQTLEKITSEAIVFKATKAELQVELYEVKSKEKDDDKRGPGSAFQVQHEKGVAALKAFEEHCTRICADLKDQVQQARSVAVTPMQSVTPPGSRSGTLDCTTGLVLNIQVDQPWVQARLPPEATVGGLLKDFHVTLIGGGVLKNASTFVKTALTKSTTAQPPELKVYIDRQPHLACVATRKRRKSYFFALVNQDEWTQYVDDLCKAAGFKNTEHGRLFHFTVWNSEGGNPLKSIGDIEMNDLRVSLSSDTNAWKGFSKAIYLVSVHLECARLTLPVYNESNAMLDILKLNDVLAVPSDTGSGKSTLLAMLLAAELGSCVVTQPRILPCSKTGEHIGNVFGPDVVDWTWGDQPRQNLSAKLVYMTDGLLENLSLGENPNPLLKNMFDVIFIDEVHERSVHIDTILLGLCKSIDAARSQGVNFAGKIPKVVIASATLDERVLEPFNLIRLNVAKHEVRVASPYPVTISDKYEGHHQLEAVIDIYKNRKSDQEKVLCFLPGQGDVRDAAEQFQQITGTRAGTLYSQMRPSVLKSELATKSVFFSTNIAETSITIEGLAHCIDVGASKVNQVTDGIAALVEEPAPRSTCLQRKGRCGRTGPGTYYPLYSDRQFLQPKVNPFGSGDPCRRDFAYPGEN